MSWWAEMCLGVTGEARPAVYDFVEKHLIDHDSKKLTLLGWKITEQNCLHYKFLPAFGGINEYFPLFCFPQGISALFKFIRIHFISLGISFPKKVVVDASKIGVTFYLILSWSFIVL